MFSFVLQDGENRVVVPVGLGLVGHVAITGDALRVVNPYDDARFHPNERIATRMRNAMYVGQARMHSASSTAASTCGGGPFLSMSRALIPWHNYSDSLSQSDSSPSSPFPPPPLFFLVIQLVRLMD